jgi:hypothetical protein
MHSEPAIHAQPLPWTGAHDPIVVALHQAATDINAAAECAGWFSQMVADQVRLITDDIDTLSIGQLRQVIWACNASANAGARS